jgi:allantoinase
MPIYDLIIRDGTLVAAEGLAGDTAQADIAIADRRIVEIAPDIVSSSAAEIDARGLHVFPGLIDAHVHFNEPGRAHWEGFVTGTQALAAGGVTTFFDMPLNSHPPVLDGPSFDLKLAAARASSLVDFGLWGGLVPGNLDRLDELAARGVVGFKAFMSNSGIAEFQAVDDLSLYEGMQRAARLGCVVAVHAENDQITGALARRAIARGQTSARDYLHSRPAIAEHEAISRAILFARETGCALHIVHVSTGRAVELVVAARADGVDVSCETCPQYLVLDEDDLERLGAVAKCAPPLRSSAEQEQLWRYLKDGQLRMVASDHSPAPPDLKQGADFFQIWGGIAGCQSTLGLLLAEGNARRGLSLSAIAKATSLHVAERFGISARKGSLRVGLDADIALVDVEATSTLNAGDLRYRHPLSPYLGRSLRGRIVRTLVRGTTVMLDGVASPVASGQLVEVARRPEAAEMPGAPKRL